MAKKQNFVYFQYLIFGINLITLTQLGHINYPIECIYLFIIINKYIKCYVFVYSLMCAYKGIFDAIDIDSQLNCMYFYSSINQSNDHLCTGVEYRI